MDQYLNSLLARIEDPDLCEDLRAHIKSTYAGQTFGLVFEHHLPETVRLPSHPITRGSAVEFRAAADDQRFIVERIVGDGARIAPAGAGERSESDDALVVPLSDLVVVRPFGAPIYPGLRFHDRVERGGDRPWHVALSAENYHALEMLLYTHEGRFDCIYIDPPYNTGARDWKYNNDYVDKNDRFRHSKWLSFMSRRLKLAKRLLKSDGVLIVTVDENEHATLTLLLKDVFPEYDITSVTVVHNPRGVQGDNFSYTHEFAVFVVPSGLKRIAPRPLTDEEREANTSNLRNWGGESLRTDARNCFYPILVEGDRIAGFGDVPPDDVHPQANEPLDDGRTAVWPIDANGVERKWRYARQSVEGIRDQLVVRRARNGDVAVHLAKASGKYKTVWQDARYDASTHGSQLVSAFAGVDFPFPKSLYAVYEALRAAVGDRPDALVLDFFAGSGTTLHATMLLNTEDGGRRTCVVVTNNEVEDARARQLRGQGHFPGDDAYERNGIFRLVTHPRLKAAVTGVQESGPSLEGVYRSGDGRSWADGFQENVAFLEMEYLDRDHVRLDRCFESLAPLLWMRAGAQGECLEKPETGWALTANSRYGVLFGIESWHELLQALEERQDVGDLYVLTKSDAAFQQVLLEAGAHLRVSKLWDDYLRTFDATRGRRL